ncbi:MAG: trypsin-like peptidase domain-containing protein, partial [Verrucomicrobiota bacterium]|nr:trypsin-like peptidase domain-containing protein [Verrucomicrobiota bacterium]
MKRFFIFVVLIALLIVGITRWRATHPLVHRPEKYTPVQSAKIDPKDVKVLAAMDEEYTKVVDAVVPSVVSITTSRKVRVPNNPYLVDPFEEFFGLRRRGPRAAPRDGVQNSLGSGVIVSKEGHVITNYHVIANMDDVKVQLNDGRIESAQLIGSDEETDIAVLKVNARDLVPLSFGDSDQVKVGQLVFAVGNPFGLQETVTQGIISAKGRRATEDSSNEFFQTDTAINPGNSGGPLVNLRGEIIGINAAIYSSSTSQASWQGVGFAIPANTARRALESVLQHGRVQR